MMLKMTFWKFSMIQLLFLSVLSFFCFTTAVDPTYLYHFCSETNFTRNSTYQSNLNTLLSTLRSNATRSNGSYNATAGQEPNKVYGLFLCRGDVTEKTCQDCVNFATSDVTRRCPVGKGIIIWYDECLLRYSNDSFFSTMDHVPSARMWTEQNSNETDNEVLSLMSKAANQAVSTPKMFATEKQNSRVLQTLYGLVQCTQDLSRDNCSTCLQDAISSLLECCSEKGGGRVLYPSCNVRYELYQFFNRTEMAPPTPQLLPPPPTVISSKGTKASWIAIGTIVSTIMVVVVFGL